MPQLLRHEGVRKGGITGDSGANSVGAFYIRQFKRRINAQAKGVFFFAPNSIAKKSLGLRFRTTVNQPALLPKARAKETGGPPAIQISGIPSRKARRIHNYDGN